MMARSFRGYLRPGRHQVDAYSGRIACGAAGGAKASHRPGCGRFILRLAALVAARAAASAGASGADRRGAPAGSDSIRGGGPVPARKYLCPRNKPPFFHVKLGNLQMTPDLSTPLAAWADYLDETAPVRGRLFRRFLSGDLGLVPCRGLPGIVDHVLEDW